MRNTKKTASQRRELIISLKIFFDSFVEISVPPERRGKSWKLTIIHQRTAIERLVKQSPSLRRLLEDQEKFIDIYQKAVREAGVGNRLWTEHISSGMSSIVVMEMPDDGFCPEYAAFSIS